MIVPLRKLIGPADNGILMTPREFDRLTLEDVEEGWRYELINGVLLVTRTPGPSERDPNDELGRILRNYQAGHRQGKSLDRTLPEHEVRTRNNRRRVDRAIWAGLGRRPRVTETPTIAVEFVSPGRRNWLRDYKAKRDEYLAIDVKEYWVIDRFARTLTVFTRQGGKNKKRVIKANQAYKTDLLPGFELPLAQLFALADDWSEED